MTDTIKTILTIASIIIFIGLVIAGGIKNYNKSAEKYGDGTHAECGGHWIVTSRGQGGTIYTCDKCHDQFELFFGTLGDL